MPPLELAPVLPVRRPYPGLRPFEVNEALLFYGRQEHTRNLLERLCQERFLAVVGSSGTGKSSLVRAGLLPALFRGYLVGASSQWRIALMRPGNAPLRALGQALAEPHSLGGDAGELTRELGQHSLGLVELVRRARLPEGVNVLLVVDQFEELFRFDRERGCEDQGIGSSLFVQSLLEAVEAHGSRIYVVITMRSDFLGHCTRFAGLAEVLNRSQFLIPHLTRAQRQEAIEKPPLLAGVSIKPALVQRLLNDLGEDPTRLPVLQHALMRTFEAGCQELDFPHYNRAGGIEGALDQHAEELVKDLDPAARQWVQPLFRSLTTVESGRAIRRPARLARLFEVLGIDGETQEPAREAARRAILAFLQPDENLLVSSTGDRLTPDSVIDISHESLIHGWRSLKSWLDKESRSAAVFKSLAEATRRYLESSPGDRILWRDPDLRLAAQIKQKDAWNPAWAHQYTGDSGPTYSEVEDFLALSEEKQAREKRKAQRLKAFTAAAVLSSLLFVLVYRDYSERLQLRKEREQFALALSLDQERKNRAALEDELKEAAISLVQAQSRNVDARGLQDRIAELEKEIAKSTKLEEKAQVRLDESLKLDLPPTVNTELEEERKKTAAVESKLKEADSELQRQKTLFEGASASSELKLRQAEKKIAALASLPPPAFLPLAPNSLQALKFPPFAGRVAIVTRDPFEWQNDVKIFLLAPKPDAPPLTEYTDDSSKSSRTAEAFIKRRIDCPGRVEDERGTGWCLELENHDKKQLPLEVGTFSFEGVTYSVTATGWASNQGRLPLYKLLIVAIFPKPASPPAGPPPDMPERGP
jgi:hypothetical protein